jgi:AbrB family transcriptional regulator (stage V sporulation protein T)
MKATGIVRRIDDLGRVVIPKEIRRTMRIREGEPLEIYVDNDGEVILKKYSPMGDLETFAKEYAESINESLGQPVFITDRDSVIAVSGASKKEFLGKSIGGLVEKSMTERRAVINNYSQMSGQSKEGSIIAEDEGQPDYRFKGEMIAPIVVQGDPIGAVIICAKEENDKFGPMEHVVGQTAAGFLAKQMEH